MIHLPMVWVLYLPFLPCKPPLWQTALLTYFGIYFPPALIWFEVSVHPAQHLFFLVSSAAEEFLSMRSKGMALDEVAGKAL